MPTAALAVNLLLGLLDRAQAIGSLIQTAHATGVDITTAQLDALIATDDQARAALVAAIAKARSGG